MCPPHHAGAEVGPEVDPEVVGGAEDVEEEEGVAEVQRLALITGVRKKLVFVANNLCHDHVCRR